MPPGSEQLQHISSPSAVLNKQICLNYKKKMLTDYSEAGKIFFLTFREINRVVIDLGVTWKRPKEVQFGCQSLNIYEVSFC